MDLLAPLHADALLHKPRDFDGVRDTGVTELAATGWTAESYFGHVGDWRDDLSSDPAAAASRPFSRVPKAN